jgi:hypothetical protein
VVILDQIQGCKEARSVGSELGSLAGNSVTLGSLSEPAGIRLAGTRLGRVAVGALVPVSGSVGPSRPEPPRCRGRQRNGRWREQSKSPGHTGVCSGSPIRAIIGALLTAGRAARLGPGPHPIASYLCSSWR